MKVRISSVAASSVSEPLRAVTTGLEDRLRPVLEGKSYGGHVEQFSAFYVSVASDPVENRPFCQMHNRSGRYKDMVTGAMVSYVSIAIPVDPEAILNAPRAALPQILENLLLDELREPAYTLPKGFDRQRLLADVEAALA